MMYYITNAFVLAAIIAPFAVVVLLFNNKIMTRFSPISQRERFWVQVALACFVGVFLLFCVVLGSNVRSAIVLNHSTVTFSENAYYLENDRYFEVVRSDGRKAMLSIDGDSDKCFFPQQQRVNTKIYFVCSGDAISAHTSYVDVEQQYVDAGYLQQSQLLSELKYE